MFKKTIVALALITASTGAFAAADLKTQTELNALEISIEGSASKVEVLAGDIVTTLGAEYSVGDIVTFTFVGADLDVATAASSIAVDLSTIVGFALGDKMTMGLLNSSTSLVTYRVTELSVAGTGTTIGGKITLSSLEFDTASLVTSTSATVTYAAETSTGVAIDSGATSTGTFLTAINQFSIAATPTVFDAIVDVEAQRLAFEGPSTTDLASFTTVSDGAGLYPATAVSMDLVLNGSFSFLDEDADTAGLQITAGQVLPTPTTITDSAITWDAVAVGAHAITVKTDKATDVTPTQAFTFNATADYTDHGTAEAAGTAAAAGTATVASGSALGAWTLNGSVVEVPFLPFGPNTQPILRHTNNGAQTGDITLRYMVEGVDSSYQEGGILVSQATPGVRNLLSQVTAALLADGYDATTTGFKVALELTSNVPAADVKVTAAAKFTTSDSDRLSIGVISSN